HGALMRGQLGPAVALTSLLAMVIVAPFIAGCEDGPKKAFDAGAARDVPSATTVAAVPSHPLFDATKPRVKLPCRAIGVEGTVRIFPSLGASDAGTPLALMDTLPLGSFVDLADGAKVTVKSPVTSRETAFKGPGRGMFCIDNEEKTWLIEGTFESSMGAGESPGSEEWVFSPYAVVRYASSNLSMKATRRRLEVNVTTGTASVFEGPFATPSADAGAPPLGARPGETWLRADAGFSAVVVPKDEKPDDRRAADMTAACATQATLTHKIALALADPKLALAAANAHVYARRDARALCGMATLWVTTLPASPKRADLVEKVTKANEDWQKID
ncbi:MAG: hypothetical protein ABIP89_13860, partial [Polyangiaceae bacterium]